MMSSLMEGFVIRSESASSAASLHPERFSSNRFCHDSCNFLNYEKKCCCVSEPFGFCRFSAPSLDDTSSLHCPVGSSISVEHIYSCPHSCSNCSTWLQHLIITYSCARSGCFRWSLWRHLEVEETALGVSPIACVPLPTPCSCLKINTAFSIWPPECLLRWGTAGFQSRARELRLPRSLLRPSHAAILRYGPAGTDGVEDNLKVWHQCPPTNVLPFAILKIGWALAV